MDTQVRRNLIIRSRGPGAIELVKEPNRTWDLCEVYWHPSESSPTSDAEYVCIETDRSRRKFRSAYMAGMTLAPRYQAVAILDDDVDTAGCTWSDAFDLFLETGACVGHPSLTRDSYSSHAISYQEPGARWREVTWVDCLAPMLNSIGVAVYWQHLGECGLGWVLCELFSQWETKYQHPAVFLDATPIHHRRQVGSAHGNAYDPSVYGLPFRSSEEERAHHLARLGLHEPVKSNVRVVR